MNIHQAIYYLVLNLNKKVDKMALDFTKLVADVAAQKTVIEGVVTLLQSTVVMLNDARRLLAEAIAANDPVALAAAQAQIDSLSADVEAHTSTLAAAVAENTVAASV
jgi:hypothetical protein